MRNIAHGEANISLADAAFQIAAEDDALVSHSSVKLPVGSYAKRIQRMADDLARNKLQHLSSVGSDRNPEEVLQVRHAQQVVQQLVQSVAPKAFVLSA